MKLIGKWQRDVRVILIYFFIFFALHRLFVTRLLCIWNECDSMWWISCNTIDRDGLFDVLLWVVVSLLVFFSFFVVVVVVDVAVFLMVDHCVYYLHFGCHGSHSLFLVRSRASIRYRGWAESRMLVFFSFGFSHAMRTLFCHNANCTVAAWFFCN